MLGFTIWLCLVGAGIIVCLRKEWHLAIKVVAAVTTLSTLLIALVAYFDPDGLGA